MSSCIPYVFAWYKREFILCCSLLALSRALSPLASTVFLMLATTALFFRVAGVSVRGRLVTGTFARLGLFVAFRVAGWTATWKLLGKSLS